MFLSFAIISIQFKLFSSKCIRSSWHLPVSMRPVSSTYFPCGITLPFHVGLEFLRLVLFSVLVTLENLFILQNQLFLYSATKELYDPFCCELVEI